MTQDLVQEALKETSAPALLGARSIPEAARWVCPPEMGPLYLNLYLWYSFQNVYTPKLEQEQELCELLQLRLHTGSFNLLAKWWHDRAEDIDAGVIECRLTGGAGDQYRGWMLTQVKKDADWGSNPVNQADTLAQRFAAQQMFGEAPKDGAARLFKHHEFWEAYALAFMQKVREARK